MNKASEDGPPPPPNFLFRKVTAAPCLSLPERKKETREEMKERKNDWDGKEENKSQIGKCERDGSSRARRFKQ